MATATRVRPDFDVRLTRTALGPNLAQQAGRLLWLPMLAMALMSFPIALGLAIAHAAVLASGGSPVQGAALGQFEVAAMFIGFATVFAAISFAIARILGVLRKGGGEVQETAGRAVQTLKMPLTGWLFLGLMMMAMMMILGAVAIHIVLGVGLLGSSAGLAIVQSWSEWLEGLRRLGASTYLLAIALGLATIVRALHFQSVRLRELPRERQAATQPVA